MHLGRAPPSSQHLPRPTSVIDGPCPAVPASTSDVRDELREEPETENQEDCVGQHDTTLPQLLSSFTVDRLVFWCVAV